MSRKLRIIGIVAECCFFQGYKLNYLKITNEIIRIPTKVTAEHGVVRWKMTHTPLKL